MRRLLGMLMLAGVGWSWSTVCAAAPLEIPVWPGVAPGSADDHQPEQWVERGTNGVVDRAVSHVSRPTITVYLPDRASATGLAILIAPGGGYNHLAIDKEGYEVGHWLSTQGIAGIVLKYRLPDTPGQPYTKAVAIADATQALKVIRARSAEWGIEPARVGMMGFSAGGNLAAIIGTTLPPAARPAFLVLLYPGIPADFGNLPADVPPTFIAQADDDIIGTENSLRLYTWMRARQLPVELHLFSRGGHGFGLGPPGSQVAGWKELFRTWLIGNGFLPSPFNHG